MHPIYRRIMRATISSALDHSGIVDAETHPGLRGEIRELLASSILRPLLPSDIGLGMDGKIIARNGFTSSEQDIVMFDQYTLPPIIVGGSAKYFPLESVLYSIEVKSTVTAADIQKAHGSAKNIVKAGCDTGACPATRPGYEDPRMCLFGFGTDLQQRDNIRSEVERYDRIRGTEPPSITAICVVGSGYWVWDPVCGQWLTAPRPQPLDEVVAFVGGVMNTYQQVAESRRPQRLGHYIIDDWEFIR